MNLGMENLEGKGLSIEPDPQLWTPPSCLLVVHSPIFYFELQLPEQEAASIRS